ncbi:helix-turn-helix domain-containing protein [Thermodesulfovibrio yellowstonii]|uniref:helix-turn-helix domain-containing protein n=1 Tax=Thermodesulfovibrio yellowstonii TaxID=28262 RepID=UPI0024B3668C|nr:helix-turn-helix domain-containing protein [Thermodesulfovibrio yellowstonii]MDI6865787.1 helix-turn-helix domain-containing protein [Thermodesulfovibrio yellowstonii]
MKLYKVSEVAELFRVSERTVYNWIDWGYMRAIKVGEGRGTIRVPEEAINEFIESNQTVIESLPAARSLLARKAKN